MNEYLIASTDESVPIMDRTTLHIEETRDFGNYMAVDVMPSDPVSIPEGGSAIGTVIAVLFVLFINRLLN